MNLYPWSISFGQAPGSDINVTLIIIKQIIHGTLVMTMQTENSMLIMEDMDREDALYSIRSIFICLKVTVIQYRLTI